MAIAQAAAAAAGDSTFMCPNAECSCVIWLDTAEDEIPPAVRCRLDYVLGYLASGK
jgi:hypothetical protein